MEGMARIISGLAAPQASAAALELGDPIMTNLQRLLPQASGEPSHWHAMKESESSQAAYSNVWTCSQPVHSAQHFINVLIAKSCMNAEPATSQAALQDITEQLRLLALLIRYGQSPPAHASSSPEHSGNAAQEHPGLLQVWHLSTHDCSAIVRGEVGESLCLWSVGGQSMCSSGMRPLGPVLKWLQDVQAAFQVVDSIASVPALQADESVCNAVCEVRCHGLSGFTRYTLSQLVDAKELH